MAEAPRISYLESIRGVASMQVVLLHFFGVFAPALVFASDSHTLPWYIHLSPLYFLYDGYSAVYVFFVLSGYVLTRSFEKHLDRPFAIIAARIVRLGAPALAATLLAAAVLVLSGKAGLEAAAVSGSPMTLNNPEPSLLAMARDGIVNALILGYSDLPSAGFLAPWQQTTRESFNPALWTLSFELYGSLAVLMLCGVARRSRALWWTIVMLAMFFTLRSAYLCFIVGHAAATYRIAEKPPRDSPMLPLAAVACGIVLCVVADIWQPQWLVWLCADRQLWLFPGQFAPMQQKAFGAIVLLAGLVHLRPVRAALSQRRLVAWSQLSFPLYLTHWPIMAGPAAWIFLVLNAHIGVDLARVGALIIGIALCIGISQAFAPVDRAAVALSRRLRARRASVTSPYVTIPIDAPAT